MFLLAVAKVVTIPPAALSYVLGFIVPVLVAILAKQNASPQIKAMLNAVLAVVAGLLAVAIKQQGHLDFYGWATAIAEAAIASWASYNHFWKPLNITPVVQAKTRNFGVGGTRVA